MPRTPHTIADPILLLDLLHTALILNTNGKRFCLLIYRALKIWRGFLNILHSETLKAIGLALPGEVNPLLVA